MAKQPIKKNREIILNDRLTKIEITRTERHGDYNHHYFINPKNKKEEMFLEAVDAPEVETED